MENEGGSQDLIQAGGEEIYPALSPPSEKLGMLRMGNIINCDLNLAIT